jgi:hypothetical protein
VLSFGIPFALVPLLILAANRDVMGALANPRWLTAFASVLAAMIIALNVFLIEQLFFAGCAGAPRSASAPGSGPTQHEPGSGRQAPRGSTTRWRLCSG